MRVLVPSATVNNEFETFPEGHYDGTISGAEVRDPNNDGSWVMIKLSLDDVTPREGTPDPGRGRFSGDITLRNTDKEGNVIDIRELSEINGSTPFAVKRGAGLLAGLAKAVGVGETDQAGNVAADLSAVAEALVDGQFAGQRIGFEVENYTSKSNGKSYDGFVVIGHSAS